MVIRPWAERTGSVPVFAGRISGAAVDPEHPLKTQGVFSTPPGNGTLPVGALRDQVIGTAILLFLVLTGCTGAWRDQHGELYFWVPIVGPLVGGVLGAGLCKGPVGRFLPTGDTAPPVDVPSRSQYEAA